MRPATGPTTGDKILSLFGQNFGANNTSPVAAVGGRQATQTTWTSDSSVSLSLPGCTSSVDMTCSNSEVSVAPSVEAHGVSPTAELVSTFPIFTYVVPPVVTSWTSDYPVRGSGGNLTVVGRNFLNPGPREVRIGGKACVHEEWISDSAIRCDVPSGRGSFKTISVRVGEGEGNLYRTFSYYPDWMAVLGPWPEGSASADGGLGMGG